MTTTPDIKLLKELGVRLCKIADNALVHGQKATDHRLEPLKTISEAAIAILALCERVETAEALLKSVAELGLRGSNGGTDNAVFNVHDAATVVRKARSILKGEL